MKRALILTSCSLLAQIAATMPVAAQEIEEIVVTAQKRAENLQDVPIAINAVTSQAAEAAGIRSTSDLAFAVSGLNITRKTEATNFNLRGVGTQGGSTGQDSAVAVFVDGVYMPSMAGATFALNNIERVEVLKGPQGTLYGRNATGGAVNVITRTPSHDASLKATLGYGNLQTVEAGMYATGGLSDKIAADVAVYYRDQGKGFGYNPIINKDVNKSSDFIVRSKLLIDLTETTRVTLAGDYGHTWGSIGIAYRPVPLSQLMDGTGYAQYAARGLGYYDSQSEFNPEINTKMFGGSAKIEQELGDVKLTSITAYRGSDGYQRVEVDALPLKIIDAPLYNSEDQFTQELQLSYENDKMKAILGAFYMDAKSRYDPFQIYGTGVIGIFPTDKVEIYSTQKTKSVALFGQVTYEIFTDTNLTIGGRYTRDKRTLDARQKLLLGGDLPAFYLNPLAPEDLILPAGTDLIPLLGAPATFNPSKTFKKPTWRIALDHNFSQDVMGYVSYSRGFKSGVYNLTSPADAPAEPETLDSMEVGIKSSMFDRRLRFNIAAFHYKYKNIQAFQVNGASTTLSNAASAKITGVDFDFEAVLGAGFSLSGSGAYLHDRYGSFPVATISYLNQPAGAPSYAGYTPGLGDYVYPACGANYNKATGTYSGGASAAICSASGNKMVNTPDWTLNLSLNHKMDLAGGKLNSNVSWSYNDGFNWAVDNRIKQKAFSLFNAQLMWTNAKEDFNVRLWGRNLGNKKYLASYDENGTGDIGTPAPGRTYGITLGVSL